jgi:tetratricopeptide (TPR) repeat protein
MSRLDKLMQMLEADPRDAFVLYAIAQEKAGAGDWAAAIGFYGRCLEVDPDYCYAWYHKAVAEQESGDAAAAVRTLESGILAAQRAGDSKAQNEMSGLMAEIRS